MPKTITPYLPKEAEIAARGWMGGNLPAFTCAIQHTDSEEACPNCGGSGAVFVKFCDGGPYRHPLGLATIVTWFDGDERYGKGWYKVSRTEGYTCPECKGLTKETGIYVPRPVDPIIEQLIERMRSGKTKPVILHARA